MGDRANQILDVIQDPLGAAKDALSTAWDAAKTGWSKAQSVMGPLWEATKQKVAQAGHALNESVLQPALAFAREKGQQAMAYMKEKFPGLANCFEVAIDLAGQATEFVTEKMEQAGAWVQKHYDKISMVGHLMLDGLGMVPGFGAIADGLNAVWYLAEGNYTDAAMSAFAAIPGIGDAAAAGKMGKRASQMMRGLDKVGDAMGGLKSGLTAAGKGIPGIPPKGLMQAADSARAAVNKLPPLPPAAGRIADEAGLAAKDFTMETVIAMGQVYASGEEMTPERMKQIVATSATGAVVARGVDNAAEKAIGGAQNVLRRNRRNVEGSPSTTLEIDSNRQSAATSKIAVDNESALSSSTQPVNTGQSSQGEVGSASQSHDHADNSTKSSHQDSKDHSPQEKIQTQQSSADDISQQHPELKEGLNNDSDARVAIGRKPESAETLANTAPKNLNQLSDKEIDTELELADQIQSKPIREGDYVEETALPNGHEWKKKEDGTLCRFSDEGFCLLPGGDKTPEEALTDTVHQDSKDIVDEHSNNVLKDRAATARASSSDLGPGTEVSGDYQNIFNTRDEGIRRADYRDFDGVSEAGQVGDDTFLRVEDKTEFIDNIKDRYKNDLGEELHPRIQERIESLIGQDNYVFNMAHGIPGLHAEVQAVNRILNRLEEEGVEITQTVLDKIQVATYRLTPKGKRFEEFGACANCQDVLLDFLKKENIITGLAER